MSNFVAIHEEAQARRLRFLVIGGLAVNHYGFMRDTADLDLFVARSDRLKWLGLFREFGYQIHNDAGNFIQFSPPASSAWPVDLMFVQDATFVPFFEASRGADFYGSSSRVPALEHLLALKVHALKNTHPRRFLKDFMDVENLIRINRLDIRSANMRDLFVKYGTEDLYEKISRSLATE